jgi:hypothetical protein
MLLLADQAVLALVPDITDETKLEDVIARKEGRMTLAEAQAKVTGYLGEEIVRGMKPLNWRMQPLSVYSNRDKEWPEPEQK